MKPYYVHIANWAENTAKGRPVVEIGSGDADFLVTAGKRMDLWGCDILEHAGSDSERGPKVQKKLANAGVEEDRYRWYKESAPLPFEDNSAAVVLSIQTLEHVYPIEHLFAEIYRILDHDGIALHYFPTAEILIEPHCQIPLAHKFDKGRKDFIRRASQLGLGKYPQYKRERSYSLEKFVEEFDHYLQQFCHFRTLSDYLELSADLGLEAKFYPTHKLALSSLAPFMARFTSVYLTQRKSKTIGAMMPLLSPEDQNLMPEPGF